jgi:hypothetical protein
MTSSTRDTLSIVLLGGGDTRDAVFPGTAVQPPLATLAEPIHARTDGRITVRVHDLSGTPIDEADIALAQLLASGEEPDLAICGFREDVQGLNVDIASGTTAVIRRSKEHDTRVIALNASTVHPGDAVSCYSGVGPTPGLTAHAIDLALIGLSMDEGISVIDVDRVIAELGGDEHVLDACAYSVAACEAIRDELVEVLADYGFFEDRPLLEQHGRRDRN